MRVSEAIEALKTFNPDNTLAVPAGGVGGFSPIEYFEIQRAVDRDTEQEVVLVVVW